MEKTEFVLTTKGSKVAEKIINAGLNINFDEGVVNITGQRAVTTLLDKDELTSLPWYYNRRLKEQEGLVIANESEDQKTLREANNAIFIELMDAVKSATEIAIGKLNTLNNVK